MAADIYSSDAEKTKRNFMLTETARCLASSSRFYAAATILDDVQELTAIDLKLLQIECFVRLGREIKAEKAMKEIQKKFLMVPAPSIEVLKALSDAYQSESSCVREIFARKLLSDMYLASDLPASKKFEGVHQCLHDIQSVSTRLYKKSLNKKKNKTQGLLQKINSDGISNDSDDESGAPEETRLQIISLDYGMRYMKSIMTTLQSMPYIDSSKRARDVSKSANAIAYFYGIMQDHKRSMEIRKKAIQIMDTEFGKFASDYNIYGDLHHNIGVALYNLDRYKEAERYYMKAVDIYHGATDYAVEQMRDNDLRKSQSDLRQTRNKL